MSMTLQVRGNSAAHHFLKIVASFLLFFAVSVQAGTFQITPTLAEIPAERRSATFTLKNPGKDEITIQVTGYSWAQQGSKRMLSDAKNLVVVPPLVTIPAGGTQIVRVADMNRNDQEESAYRVQFLEIPNAVDQGSVMLRTALKLDVPLFFLPEAPSGKVDWRATKTASGKLVLTISNHGNIHARFSKLVLQDARGNALGRLNGPLYLLPGTTRKFHFATRKPIALGDELTVEVTPSRNQGKVDLVVE